MKLSVSETAKLMGVSVRTLHYYDEIGLLKPSETSEAGYRFYDEENLAVLQEILFYRELEFPLKEILRMLSHPEHDRSGALKKHRELLLLKRQHIEELLRLVDDTLGGEAMNKNRYTFADIEEAKSKYAAEAKARWGQTEAYQESARRDKNRTQAESVDIMNETNDIFASFAASMDKEPSDPEVQALVERWQALITKNHYTCTKEILEGLADMYISDERFIQNLDRFGDGTAQFMHDAIKAYCGG
jgi:DNA-binding transcriptional MerR regulator